MHVERKQIQDPSNQMSGINMSLRAIMINARADLTCQLEGSGIQHTLG
jgi:hypothetical protein